MCPHSPHRLLILRALHLRTLPGLLEVLPHMALVWRASPGVLYMLVLTVRVPCLFWGGGVGGKGL